MEEETGQPFTFMGRWRGRNLWILMGAALLAAAAVLLLVLVNPSRDSDTGQASPAREEAAQAETSGETTDAAANDMANGTAGSQTEGPAIQEGREQPTMTPGTGENATGMTVEFPDPAESAPETPPPGGYKDICGRWILDMNGTAYALSNCHIILNEDGTISSPPDYEQVFQIAGSTYSWQEGSPAFSASIQLILKMSSGQVLVPVLIELRGDAADSLLEIKGDFTAEPQGEAYAPYAQQGGFIMHR